MKRGLTLKTGRKTVSSAPFDGYFGAILGQGLI
jgi:hypothetical protein